MCAKLVSTIMHYEFLNTAENVLLGNQMLRLLMGTNQRSKGAACLSRLSPNHKAKMSLMNSNKNQVPLISRNIFRMDFN